ncbi:MAG: drug/metabolite transporter (DMT)-like permease [Flavobacteriales bacterium]|jgi:drug/metabolite transporter (DMT)-like permease
MKGSGPLLMLISVFLFTAANVLVKLIADLPTTQIVFLRSSISLVMCASFVLYKGFPFFGKNKKWLIIRGAFGVVALTLFFYTIQNIPLASATVIQYLSPIFTMILAMVWLKQKVRPIQWVFLAIAFIGVLFVKGIDNTEVPLKFLFIGVLGAFFASVAYFATMKCKDTDHPVLIVMYFHLLATPIMGTISIVNWQPIDLNTTIIGLSVGVLSVIAQVAMAAAILKEEASAVVPIKYVGAILALGIGYFFFHEELSLTAIFGIFLVIAGVTLNTFIKK